VLEIEKAHECVNGPHENYYRTSDGVEIVRDESGRDASLTQMAIVRRIRLATVTVSRVQMASANESAESANESAESANESVEAVVWEGTEGTKG
jgi:hypothetical protein